MWSPHCWMRKGTFRCRFHRFLMCLCVILGSGEYTTGFVLVLTVGWLWSGSFSRHACHSFRATRVNFGGRDTTSVVASRVLEIPALERAIVCHQVGFCFETSR